MHSKRVCCPEDLVMPSWLIEDCNDSPTRLFFFFHGVRVEGAGSAVSQLPQEPAQQRKLILVSCYVHSRGSGRAVLALPYKQYRHEAAHTLLP